MTMIFEGEMLEGKTSGLTSCTFEAIRVSGKHLPRTLPNLPQAAFGINRPECG